MDIPVTNRLQVPILNSEVDDLVKGACTHSNPSYYKAKAMGHRFTREKPQIFLWRDEGECMSLPRGCTDVVREHYPEAELVCDRHDGEPSWAGVHPSSRVTLWEHQERIVETVLDMEQGLVKSPTGSGKTTAAIAAIARAQLPTIIIVWNAELLNQWVERLMDELGLEKDEIGILGGGVERWRPITVAMQQTLSRSPAKLKRATEVFGFVCCDEVQRFAAGTFGVVIDAFPARYRIGFSADHTRKDGKAFLIHAMFGKVICSISRKELESKQLVMPVKVRMVPTEFRADWYIEQQKKAAELRDAIAHETNGHKRNRLEMELAEVNPDFTRLLAEMTADKKRNAIINDWIHKVRAHHTTVVLTHRVQHALNIQADHVGGWVACGLLLGGKENAEEFSGTMKAMRAGKLDMAVGTYQAFGVGLDIKPIDRGVCVTPIHSNRQFFGQVRGRICRKCDGKKDAEMVYLWDRELFGDTPVRNLLAWNDKNVEVLDGGRWVPGKEYLKE